MNQLQMFPSVLGKWRVRKAAGATRSLVNVMSQQLECTRMLHEALLMAVLMYVSETMMWREKGKSRIRAVRTTSEVF